MKRVVLHDIDSRVPNFALMKLSTHYRERGWEVRLSRPRAFVRWSAPLEADLHLASTVFHTGLSRRRAGELRERYGDRLELGGSGHSLEKRLPPEVEEAFPDYGLYRHKL